MGCPAWREIRWWRTHSRSAELGRLLRRLHLLKPPESLSLPNLHVLDQAQGRIERARGLSEAERGALSGEADRLSDALPKVEFRLPRSVIHGDANIGNVLKQPDGRVVMFDLGGVCWGPPEWDLTATAVYRDLGWHSEDEYREFCEVYGFDVAQLSGWPVLKALQELRMVCWLAMKFEEDEEIADEVRRRVDDLAHPGRARDWRPY
ncbi:phosphotransferase [Sphaerisporangium sp. NPDC051017]|uniref:phosphotransferase enzyme family protein n=1 Tax=Sphaerisporangium sp. NPDC051017 TaxID=3154636 RepID=UPI00342BB950